MNYRTLIELFPIALNSKEWREEHKQHKTKLILPSSSPLTSITDTKVNQAPFSKKKRRFFYIEWKLSNMKENFFIFNFLRKKKLKINFKSSERLMSDIVRLIGVSLYGR